MSGGGSHGWARAWAAAVALATFPLAAAGGPGPLVAVGGALSPGNEAVFRAILERASGGPICVLPTASGQPRRSMASYVKRFRRYGGPSAARGVAISAKRPRRAAAAETAVRLLGCGGFFFTGGDQSRIVDALRPGGEPTPAASAIRERWRQGAVIAGTSAGAAMMSDPMIGGGSSTEAFEHGAAEAQDELGVWVRGGMGFLARALVEQHCLARGRFGRLLVAVASRPEPRRGLCIDEDTALVVEGEEATVIGASGVVILDLFEARRLEERGFRRGRLWLLGDGDRLRPGAESGWPEAGKRPWRQAADRRLAAPAEPWVQVAFHRFLIRFAGSPAESVSVGEGAATVRLRKGEGFRALSRDADEPRDLFAGPIEIDWVPGTDSGLDLNPGASW